MTGSVRRGPAVAASLMCADFRRLDDQLTALGSAGVTRLHLDFADGWFVPNLILGTEVFALIQGQPFCIESHLMIREPARFVETFCRHSDVVIVHLEALTDPAACFRRIRDAGASPGLALSPDTPLEAARPWLPSVTQVLIMTVQPGFAGGRFLPTMLDKVRGLRRLTQELATDVSIEVDGAVNLETISLMADAGADIFVGGSSGLFNGEDVGSAARRLISAASFSSL